MLLLIALCLLIFGCEKPTPINEPKQPKTEEIKKDGLEDLETKPEELKQIAIRRDNMGEIDSSPRHLATKSFNSKYALLKVNLSKT